VVILFDGVCNLCSSSVQFIINRDPTGKFKFASLQSAYGQKQLDQLGLDRSNLFSIILLKQNRFYQQSDAALEVARELSSLWPAFYIFKILPRFFRDAIYDWISRNRYRWFGKKDACWLPSTELKSRFID
jgi:predicted DCC family thiol-disulfide oxidoreductase YuxK